MEPLITFHAEGQDAPLTDGRPVDRSKRTIRRDEGTVIGVYELCVVDGRKRLYRRVGEERKAG